MLIVCNRVNWSERAIANEYGAATKEGDDKMRERAAQERERGTQQEKTLTGKKGA
jgi:hypothetical protein